MLTVVTALFDIGRGNLEGQWERHFAFYQEHLANLLQTNLNIVLFCEPSLVDWAKERAKNLVVVPTELQSLRDERFDKIQKIRTNPDWYNQTDWLKGSPQGALEFYNPVVMAKPKFLKRATELNPFKTKYFLWLDAGVGYSTSMHYFREGFAEAITPYMNETMLFWGFQYRKKEQHGFKIEAMDHYAGHEVQFIVRATMFGAERDVLIKEFIPEYYRYLDQSLNDGYMGTEENILTILSYTHPWQTYIIRWDQVSVGKFLDGLKY